MTNGVVSHQWRQPLRCEHMRDQPGVLVQPGSLAIGYRDARCLLAPML